MDRTEAAKIVVAGTGPAGLLAALALAQGGFEISLVGPAANQDDRRTTALMAPALKFLHHLGLLAELEPHCAPLRAMRIIDATQRLIRSPTVTFHASEIGEAHFGLNIPNRLMNVTFDSSVVVLVVI